VVLFEQVGSAKAGAVQPLFVFAIGAPARHPLEKGRFLFGSGVGGYGYGRR